MNEHARVIETESSDPEPSTRKPYVPPCIAEEESFETFALACVSPKGICGTNVPRS
ncbi:MAG TPA: hypothetical protein PLI95_30795 [Polyangiaceae bacterium]|nr:hypothetical protein [Polyangiaceae bacterium]